MAPLDPAVVAAAGEPLWGPVTATLDWCESNYAVCLYIAEFWNTVTNLTMITLAVCGMVATARAGAEFRFQLSNFGIMLVGIGSWCFHGSLLYEMQLLDELPMVYTTAVFIYCISLQDPKKRHSPALALFLLVLCAAITAVYVWWKEPLFHQVCYGLMVAYLTATCTRTAYRFRDDRALVRVLVAAVFLFLAAWGLWNIDIHFCQELREMREHMGPFAPLLELHAWWHVLTAYSSYLQVVFSTAVQLRVCGKGGTVGSMGFFGLTPCAVAGGAARAPVRRLPSKGEQDGAAPSPTATAPAAPKHAVGLNGHGVHARAGHRVDAQ